MIRHIYLTDKALWLKILRLTITLAGNNRLKIYGTLRCHSGKRMKKETRVFFLNDAEAIQQGFRPCAHCMPRAYRQWKSEQEAG
ncbi:MAG TPA: Ada metal-binding domain-containing protein [Ohtaekwangia sp.]|uniref:Ada metal-binding domain-containing protein n=1 Tax=Ohtaekwangia sp. TaxID=2066019 RepID=UPI002F924D34